MPRKRNKENLPLPVRWQFTHGAYYYRVPPGLERMWDGKKRYRLGKTLAEAYREWANHIGTLDSARNIDELLDRYALEVIPTKANTTQTLNLQALKKLRVTFGSWPLIAIEPHHIYTYADARTKAVKNPDGTERREKAYTAALHEIEVLSHAFTKAVEWGYIKRHPFAHEVRLKSKQPRDRYVEDWEIAECLAIEPKRKLGGVRAVQAYIRVKVLTGLSRGDLLRLEPDVHFLDDGIHVQRHKTKNSTGKRTLYLWNDDLRSAVAAAQAARPAAKSRWLFCTRKGECYIKDHGRAGGWESLWSDFMARVMAETKVTEPFNEHDIRAKAASDAESLEQARALLSHADSRTTQRIYRRKAERVNPLKKPG